MHQFDAGGADQQHGAPAGPDPQADGGEQAGEREDREIGEAGGPSAAIGLDVAGRDAEQARGVVEARAAAR